VVLIVGVLAQPHGAYTTPENEGVEVLWMRRPSLYPTSPSAFVGLAYPNRCSFSTSVSGLERLSGSATWWPEPSQHNATSVKAVLKTHLFHHLSVVRIGVGQVPDLSINMPVILEIGDSDGQMVELGTLFARLRSIS